MTLLNVSLDIVYILVLSSLLHSLATQKLFIGTKCPPLTYNPSPSLSFPFPSSSFPLPPYKHSIVSAPFVKRQLFSIEGSTPLSSEQITFGGPCWAR